jgi:hypothetical protein
MKFPFPPAILEDKKLLYLMILQSMEEPKRNPNELDGSDHGSMSGGSEYEVIKEAFDE